ncbi:MAG: DUF3179 domain-containing protein [Bacteroidales bacterium]|nr:DUF3179 domain-containing protein [Bacteroidales bacterium]
MKKVVSSSIVFLFIITVVVAQNNPKNLPFNWKTDTANRIVSLDEFTALLMPDGIPPIDEPKFWDREKAENNYFTHEPVVALEISGEAKAYPLSVLMYHEIVNDEAGSKKVTITYCPLCNTAVVYDRRLEFEGVTYLLDFGVSGMLRNSDLVMWDRQTQSWWQQLTGEALVGKLAGARLNLVSSMLISLEEFFETYPEGKILSTETGHFSEYGSNPYTGYDALTNEQPRLFKGEVDPRLPAMERVIDIQIESEYKIYPLSSFEKTDVINDQFKDTPVVLFHTSKTVSVVDKKNIAESKQVGSVTVFSPLVEGELLHFEKRENGFRDMQTGSEWNIAGKCISGIHKGKSLTPIPHGNHFAFAWLAFHPESDIFSE